MAFSTPISTSAPASNAFPSNTNPLVPTVSATFGTSVAGGVPHPTNSWCTDWYVDGSAGTSSYNGPSSKKINVFPYMLRYKPTGLDFCIPKNLPAYEDVAIINEQRRDMSFYASEAISSTFMTSLDDFGATLRFEQNASNYMSAPIVRGMPYITMQYNALTPKIYTGNSVTDWPTDADNHTRTFTSVNGSSSGTVTGTKFTIVTTGEARSGYPKGDGLSYPIEITDTQTWILYASSSISLTIGTEALTNDVTAGKLTATAAYTGTLRLVRIQQAGDEAIYDTFKDVIPTGGSVDATFSGNTATKTFSFTSTGGSNVLLFALPHHQDSLVSPTYQNITWSTLRGTIRAVSGASWQTTESLPTITWQAPNAIDSGKIAAIQAAVQADIDYPSPAAISIADVYNAGKGYGALARLVLVADVVGDTTSRATLLTKLKNVLSPWFDGSSARFYYDTTWGGVIAEVSRGNGANSHGNGYYNDHHYHWGYFIYAAAVAAHFDAAWGASVKSAVDTLVRDIANPSSSDTYFTKFRHTDWYEGHSWPGGLASSEDGRNQESTSEAINAWYGMVLWGTATGNNDMVQNGKLLLAQEMRATQKYWFMPTSSSIYPSGTMKDKKTIGIIFQNKVTTNTWFGDNPEYHTGIQALPFTPMSELHLEQTWATEAWTSRLAPNTPGGTTTSWLGYNYSLQAVSDPAAAWTNISNLTGSSGAGGTQWDWEGTTKANMLWWAATRTAGTPPPPPGQVTGLSSPSKTNTSVNLSWSSVSGATSYRYEWKLTSSGTWTIGGTSGSTTAIVSGLSAETSYDFRVVAYNSGGDGPASTVLTVTTSAGSPPGQVTGLTSPSKTSTSVNLSWSSVSGATSYRYEWKLTSGVTWATGGTTGGTTGAVSSLTAETSYDFRVFATNGSGDGPASTVLTITTSAASGGAGGAGTIGDVVATSSALTYGQGASSIQVRTGISDSNYSPTATDNIIGYVALTAPRTVTLPSAATIGREIVIKDESGSCSGTNTITIVGSIDGAGSIILTTAHAVAVLYSNGSTWSRVI